VLCGSKEFIRKAHRLRKMLGGGMRQAGILAAAGIVALETMVGRLVEDHVRARKLAEGLKQVPGLVLDPQIPPTNMVFLSLAPEIKTDIRVIVEKLKEYGILVDETGRRSFRLVLHYWIDDTGVEKTIGAFRTALHQ
jgi:threonine aldolase